ncbi:hypothetical protein V8E36_002499 [Tilletia maclaganii]
MRRAKTDRLTSLHYSHIQRGLQTSLPFPLPAPLHSPEAMAAAVSAMPEAIKLDALSQPTTLDQAHLAPDGRATLPAADVHEEAIGQTSISGSQAELVDSSSAEVMANLPPVDGGRGAWLYLLGATITEINVFGVSYSYGAILAFHESNPSSPFHQSSASALSAVGSILVGFSFAMPYLALNFFHANPHLILKSFAVANVLSFVSLMSASFLPANAAGPLILLQGVIPGICGGLMFLPCQLWLSQWFDKRRGAAAAILYLGSGLGGVAFPLLFDALLKVVAFRWTLRTQAAIQFLLACTSAALLRPRLPIRKPALPASHRSQWRRYLPASFMPLLCVTGAVATLITFSQAAAWTAISLYLSTLCISIGLSETTANGILAAYNGSAVASFMMVAFVIDRLSTGTLMAVSTAGCGVAAYLLLGFASSLSLVLPFVLAFGILGAGFSAFIVSMARAVMHANPEPSDFTQLSCIFILIRGIGATVGPLIASVLYDASKAAEHDLWGSHGMKRLIIFSGSVMSGVALICVGFRHQLRAK